MNDKNMTLTDDQQERIEATLKRIRVGLLLSTDTISLEEPLHIFVPETFYVNGN